MPEVVLQAPMSGWALPLGEVPDPVFAQGMAGQGYAIDPVDAALYAPCAGEITQLHRCLHALTLKHESGLEILMHVGIDSVQLAGKGFRPRVKIGDQVMSGALLLEFDSDLIARECRSLITVIVLPDQANLRGSHGQPGKVVQGDPWMKVELLGEEAVVEEVAEQYGGWLKLPNPTGIHARPAARLVGLVKELPGPIFIESENRKASARSLVALLGLGLGYQDRLRVVHRDLNQTQLEQLESEILAGLGDDLTVAPPTPVAEPPKVAAPDGSLHGVVASSGMAVGPVYFWKRAEFTLPDKVSSLDEERESWRAALRQGKQQIEELRARAPHHEKAIFSAHLELLEDPEILQQVQSAIEAGQGAARSWSDAYQGQASILEALPNPLLAARANDLRDVGERLLGILLGGAPQGPRQFPQDCIILAQDLNPSDTLQLDPSKVAGLCLAQGGPSSHVAILSRSLGIPSLCALGPSLMECQVNGPVVLDAEQGRLLFKPDELQLLQARERIEALRQQRDLEQASAKQPAQTKDGKHVEVAVNIGKAEDLRQGLDSGGEGVGLFRSEFYFHQLSEEPGSEQQVKVYGEIAQMLGPERRFVARLLDVGGDKPLSYVPMPHEENPFLGVRGIRLFSRRPELFRRQIGALLETSGACKLAILVPMVASLREWRAIRCEIEQLAQGRPVELGVMIEVPSAALIADRLAPEVDFFSIGTNDLTQYTLAIDRGHPDLAGEVDPLHPALLHLMQRVGQAAARHGRWVGVCGGAAQDPEAIPLLLGMNVTELSVSPPAVAAVKAEVRRWALDDCQQLVEQALQLSEAIEVRNLVKERRK